MGKVITHCEHCGHSFVIKKQRSGIGYAVVGAGAGYAIGHKGETCKCPNCGNETYRPKR